MEKGTSAPINVPFSTQRNLGRLGRRDDQRVAADHPVENQPVIGLPQGHRPGNGVRQRASEYE